MSLTAFGVLTLLLFACGDSDREPSRLTVLTASSLEPATRDLQAAFSDAHPDVVFQTSHAGSHTLALQVEQGLRGDVLLSADPHQVTRLHRAGLAEAPRSFASNQLVIGVSEDSSVRDLSALTQVERLVVGVREVPLGRYTGDLLDAASVEYGPDWRADVESRIVSRESSAGFVVAKVELGEADAAIVYRTDVRRREGMRAIELPAGLVTDTTYAHARLSSTEHPELAEAWVSFVESADGQRILAQHGFGAPEREP